MKSQILQTTIALMHGDYILAEISSRGVALIVIGALVFLQLLQRYKQTDTYHSKNAQRNIDRTVPKNKSDLICNSCQRKLHTATDWFEQKDIDLKSYFDRIPTSGWEIPRFCSYCGAENPKKIVEDKKNRESLENLRVDFPFLFENLGRETEWGFYRTTEGGGGVIDDLFNRFARSSLGRSIKMRQPRPKTYEQAVKAFGITAEKCCKGRKDAGCGYLLVNEEDMYRNGCPECATKWDETTFVYRPKCCHGCRIYLQPSARFCFNCGKKYKGYLSSIA